LQNNAVSARLAGFGPGHGIQRLSESAQDRWRAFNAPHLVAPVRAWPDRPECLPLSMRENDVAERAEAQPGELNHEW